MGLVVNASKCQLIADSKLVVDYCLLDSFTRVMVKESSLLGAPMFPDKTLDASGRLDTPISLLHVTDLA